MNAQILALEWEEGEIKMWDNEIRREFELILFEFVKRAASKDATALEVKTLPEVARILYDIEFNP